MAVPRFHDSTHSVCLDPVGFSGYALYKSKFQTHFCKAGAYDHLTKWLALAGPGAAPARIVYGGNMSFVFQGVQIVSWKDIHAVFADAVGNEIG
jgi:hypothetical protein